MLSLFIAAALLAQAPIPSVPAAKPNTSVSFTVNVPPIPTSKMGMLPLRPSRKLIPLVATLTLDSQVEETREEDDLVAAINSERTSRGLGPLASDQLLIEAARAHCREMSALHYFAHRSPTPGDETPIDRYLDALHQFREKRPSTAVIGENIFFASVTNALYNAGYAHQRLMASTEHRENILEPRFTKVGVGLYRDPVGRFWVTEMFLGSH